MSIQGATSTRSDEVDKGRWALLAAGSGAVFALLGAAVFAHVLAVYTVVQAIWWLGHPEPDTAQLSSSVADAYWTGPVVVAVAFMYASVVSVPIGIVGGIVNAAAARRFSGHPRIALAGSAVVVGVLTGALLPSALDGSLGLSWLSLAVGGIAGGAAAAQLRHEQRKLEQP